MHFRQKLLATFLALFLTLFAVFGIFTLFRFNKEISGLANGQKKLLNLYSKELLSDLQVGKYIAVKRKLDYLIDQGDFQSVTVLFGDTEINSVEEKVDEDKGFLINFFVPTSIKVIEIKLKDQFSTEWGTVNATISFDSLLRDFKSDFRSYTLYFFSFLFIFLAIILLLVQKLENPIVKLTNLVSSKVMKPINKGSNDEILMLTNAFHIYQSEIEDAKKIIAKKSYEEGEVYVARQLSHDIRSPLAALKVVKDVGTTEMAPEMAKLLTMSIDRIADIANTILPKGEVKNSSAKIEPCFLWMLLDQIISEKRVEYRDESNISIQFESNQSPFLMNAFCNSTEFMRSISNMVNNSIEARVLNKPLEIKVRLSETEDQIVLSIVDNGKGIPAEILSRVFDESFSHEKKQGTGLGLHQVKQAVESWGGKIGIESQVKIGTTLTIKLKKSEKPEWLTEPIEIKNYSSIVVLDDEEYVFTILEDRFSKYGKKIEYFKSIKEFESKLAQHENRTLYLMDHDLKQGVTGLQLIEKHQLQTKAILLTGNYDDKSVQQMAIKINAKILPKPLIHDLPIVS